jgi:hypothetical protein
MHEVFSYVEHYSEPCHSSDILLHASGSVRVSLHTLHYASNTGTRFNYLLPPRCIVDSLEINTPSEIDAFISRLEEARCRLRSARNALLPVSRLPVEVLSTIFLNLLLPPPQHDLFGGPSYQDVRAASQVCGHWRAVVLNCSSLWTHIQVWHVNPLWTGEMLRRSKRSLISFRANLWDPQNPSPRALEACNLVLEHIDRISEMHLHGDAQSLQGLLNTMTTQAPRLRSLVVSNRSWWPDAEVVQLPPDFIASSAPRLERLQFVRCFFSWNEPLLLSCPDLRYLQMQGSEADKPSASQILRVLGGMPRLTTLRVEKVILSGTTPSSCSLEEELVYIPKVEEVSLGGHTVDIATLLSRLAFPRSTFLSLDCELSDRTDELSFLAAALASQVSSRIPVRALHVSLKSKYCSLYTSMTDRIVEESVWKNPQEGSMHLTLTGDSDQLHSSNALQVVSQALLLNDVELLFVDDDNEFLNKTTCGDLLRRMPNLQTLRACNDAGSHLVAALDASCPNGTPCKRDDGSAVVVPRLETLVLEQADMWSIRYPLPLGQALQEVQFARSYCVHPVPELHIKRCMNIGRSDIDTLCHLFTDVQWDGFEVFISDEDEDESEADVWSEVYNDYWEYEAIGWHP